MFGLMHDLNSTCEPKEEDADGLSFEKHAIKQIMKRLKKEGSIPEACRKKNAEDSTKYRIKGNNIYLSVSHDKSAHQNAWKLYTQSIALAPNKSEELAMAYGNRSALLFHLSKFEDCIKDCDRGLSVSSSDLLKAKLEFRKIECLIALKEKSSRNECEKALVYFEQLSLADGIKSEFTKKIKNSLKIISKMELRNDQKKTTLVCEELPVFEHQKESPCASKSVTIKHEQKWGRHIVATRDIAPGEIFVVEKSYFSFIYPDGMYLHCSNCVKPVCASIPCEHCIYDVYCSEKCKVEAWTKYHQFECPVFPYLWDIEKDRKACTSCIRFMLISVHEAGGIDQLRNEFISYQSTLDPRTKGFSPDGVFDSSKSRSANSLAHNRRRLNQAFIPLMAQNACDAVYYLATKTNFFGIKLDASRTKILKIEDILFIGAVILHNFFMLPCNYFTFDVYHSYYESITSHGASIHPFCSFFNHSCDPNARYFTSKNNELVVFAKHPIKKGSQVFVSYFHNSFMDKPKSERQEYLKEVYQFTCKCVACNKNWDQNFLKSHRLILKDKPKLAVEMQLLLQNLTVLQKDPDAEILNYHRNFVKELANALNIFAEKVTVHSIEYDLLIEYIYKMYIKTFGNWFIDVPEKC